MSFSTPSTEIDDPFIASFISAVSSSVGMPGFQHGDALGILPSNAHLSPSLHLMDLQSFERDPKYMLPICWRVTLPSLTPNTPASSALWICVALVISNMFGPFCSLFSSERQYVLI